MKYFRLIQDTRQQQGVLFQKMLDIPAVEEVVKGNILVLDRMTVVFVQSGRYNSYPPLLDRQLFMVKSNIQQIFKMYMPEIEYRHFCLVDRENAFYTYYHLPQLVLADCFCKEKSDCNLDTSSVTHTVLYEKMIPQEPIFRLRNVKDTVVVVNLPVAESLLRRKIEYIWFDPIELI